MIFYFTGTGNSWAAANSLAEATGEKLCSIASEMERVRDGEALHYELGEQELLGLVFPVYAWGPPRIALEFIRRLQISGRPYIFSVTTCGEEEGQATRILERALQSGGLFLDAGFTLIMPNNYIIGYDIDAKEMQVKKLQEAADRLADIALILQQRTTGVFQLIPGKFSRLKFSAVNWVFLRYGRTTKYFTVTDRCNGCGLCASSCPVRSITMDEQNDEPVWQGSCEQCFACIHRCPQRAIQYEYGKGTRHKGRYVHPDYR